MRKDPKPKCPFHGTELDQTTRTIDHKGKRYENILVSYCKKCHCYYTNNNVALSQDHLYLYGFPLKWTPTEYAYNRERDDSTANLTNALIHVTRGLAYGRLPKNHFWAPAYDTIMLKHNHRLLIQGRYDIGDMMFYSDANSLLACIYSTKTSIPEKMMIDKQNLLKMTAAGRNFNNANKMYQKANGKSQKEDIPQKAPDCHFGLLYTVPWQENNANTCPFCHKKLKKQALVYTMGYIGNKADTIVDFYAPMCKSCNIPFLTSKRITEIQTRLLPRHIRVFNASLYRSPKDAMKRAEEVVETIPQNSKPLENTPPINQVFPYNPSTWEKGTPIFSNVKANKYLLIYANKCHCNECEKRYRTNTICERAAYVETAKGDKVKVSVQFCMGCGKFFMNLKSYYGYTKKYGPLKFHYTLDSGITLNKDIWNGFQEDSILSQNGYSVRQGVSKSQRQAVLANILDNHLAPKYVVVELLSQFIRIQHNRLPEACQRWQEDLAFVNDYQIDSRKIVGELKMTQAGKFQQR